MRLLWRIYPEAIVGGVAAAALARDDLDVALQSTVQVAVQMAPVLAGELRERFLARPKLCRFAGLGAWR